MLNLSIDFLIDDQCFNSSVVNISEGGALLKINDRHQDLDAGIVGKEALFNMTANLPVYFKSKGKIVRFFENNGKYIAVRFLEYD